MASLSWWFAPHPAWEPGEDWPEEVPVVRYETEADVALIDPLLPPDDSFDPHGKPVRVLLTYPAHYRGTDDFIERYGATVWAPPKAEWRRRPKPVTTDEIRMESTRSSSTASRTKSSSSSRSTRPSSAATC